jgi:hypothetical protein
MWFSQKKWLILSVCAVLTLAEACSQKAKSAETQGSPPPAETSLDPKLLNDAARFLAGLHGNPQSAYLNLESTQACRPAFWVRLGWDGSATAREAGSKR